VEGSNSAFHLESTPDVADVKSIGIPSLPREKSGRELTRFFVTFGLLK
jgi:hypothetical protein